MRLKEIFKYLMIPFVAIFLFNTFSNTVNAEEGDFYKRKKAVIEKELAGKPYENTRDMIKSYDSKTNTFNCGTFDIACEIHSLTLSMEIGMVAKAHETISNMIVKPSAITGNSVFKGYKNGLASFATTMLAIFLMWQVMKIVASRYADSSDGTVAINDKLLMVLTCGILLGIYDDFFIWVLQFQEVVVNAVMNDPFKKDDLIMIIFLNHFGYGFLMAVIIGAVLFVFSIAYMYRFVLFGLLYVVGVVAIPTGVNDEYNYFSLWLKTLINNGVTLFLQSLCFSIGFQALIKNNIFSKGASMSVALAFFILALAVPSILGQMGASSGSGRAIGTVVRQAMRR